MNLTRLSFLRLGICGFCLAFASEVVAEVTSRPFGTMPDGTKVTLYELTAANGVKVTIMDYGATIVNWVTPDRDGKLADVVLGFDSVEGYLQKGNPYIGAAIGRYGNRIAGGKFELDGKTYTLATNDGANHLHGGVQGFDKVMWEAKAMKKDNAVRFRYKSKDGEEGYPGNLDVTVTYTLLPDTTLVIDYEAKTDKTTVVNLTNHAYFNLAAKGTVKDHVLTLHAPLTTPVGAGLIPTGEITSVKGTPFDFTTAKRIGDDLEKTGLDPKGFDHNWVLGSTNPGGLRLAAELYEPTTGRYMTVETTEPGIQFYSGNFLDGTLKGKGGQAYQQYAGLCLETQHFPDSPNQLHFPTTTLEPGEKLVSQSRYRITTR